MREPRAVTARAGGAVGYVLKAYPRTSEIFIISEIERLERKGVPLRLFAIKPAEPHDREPRHPVVDRVQTVPEFLPSVTSLSSASLLRWLRLNWRGFRGSFWRMARRRPVGMLRAAVGLAVQTVRTRLRGGRPKNHLREFLRAAALADRMLQEPRIGHLHAHYAHDATTIAWLASRITGIPFSFTAHARDLYCQELNPGGLLRRKLRAARFAVTCTEANRRFLQDVDRGTPVHRLYHGLNADFSRLLRTHRPTEVARPPVRVIGVGRLVEKKGFDVLIRAIERLRRTGVDAELTIVGPDGSHAKALRQLAIDLGLSAVVRFTGALSQADLLQEYAGASVFCLPCRVLDDGDRDGIPNVLMEAMAAGLPVVTTTVSGIPELIGHDANGILVAPDAPEELAEALRRVASDTSLSSRLARSGRETVRDRFDGDTLAAQLAALFAREVA